MPDDTTIIFKLRKGAKTAPVAPLNGREVTADDVAYSFQRLVFDPKSLSRGNGDILKSVEAIDKYTVKFTGKQRSLLLLETAATVPLFIIHREVVEKFGDLRNQALGAGAFYQERKQPAVGLFLKKNPNYYDADKVGPDQLEYLTIPDNAAVIAAFRTGKLSDLSYGGISKADKDALLRTNPDIQVADADRGGNSVMSLRSDQPDKPWADFRVRKAMSMGIDREGLITAMYGGEGLYSGYVPCQLPQAVPCEELKGLDIMKFNATEAKRLLAEAGYPKGFKFMIIWPTKGVTPSPVTQLLASMWQKNLGLTVDLETEGVSSVAWRAQGYSGDYTDMAQVGGPGLPNWYEFLTQTISSKGRWPWFKFTQFDKDIDDIMVTLDPKEQIAKTQALQRLLLTSEKYGGYAVLIPAGKNFAVAQPWIKNWHPMLRYRHHRYLWIDQSLKR